MGLMRKNIVTRATEVLENVHIGVLGTIAKSPENFKYAIGFCEW